AAPAPGSSSVPTGSRSSSPTGPARPPTCWSGRTASARRFGAATCRTPRWRTPGWSASTAGPHWTRRPGRCCPPRFAPGVRLSPVPSYLMWAVTGDARKLGGRAGDPPGGLGDLDSAGLHAAATRAIRRWHPDLVRLVALAAVPATTLIAVRTAAPLARWPASRVTLLGDAIHAMSP